MAFTPRYLKRDGDTISRVDGFWVRCMTAPRGDRVDEGMNGFIATEWVVAALAGRKGLAQLGKIIPICQRPRRRSLEPSTQAAQRIPTDNLLDFLSPFWITKHHGEVFER